MGRVNASWKAPTAVAFSKGGPLETDFVWRRLLVQEFIFEKKARDEDHK